MRKTFYTMTGERGAVMMVALIFFIVASTAIVLGLTGPSAREFKVANDSILSKQSYFLAESGGEDAFYRLKNGMAIGSTETITLGSSTSTATISTVSGTNKEIDVIGNVINRQRSVKLILAPSTTSVTFHYGTQSGQGGIYFMNNAYLNGNLYSNGIISGSNGAYVTGSAYSATSSGSISGMCVGGTLSGSTCSGTASDAHAHTVTNTKVTGTLYCATGSGNNQACNTSQPDPATVAFPISSTDITNWENDALTGGTVGSQSISASATSLGPVKISGNLTVSGSGTLTLGGTVWVTGDVNFSGSGGGSNVNLASSYGTQSGIIVVDGRITIGNGVSFHDSGTTGSYILLLSNSTCDETNVTTCGGHNAIEIGNNATIVIANAQNGTVSFSNNSTVKEVVGYLIRLKNNVGINYGSGTVNAGFTSGPGGGWATNTWQEY